MPNTKPDSSSSKMENRTIAMYPEMWNEICRLAEGREGAPGMARECIRRGLLQMQIEQAKLRQQEALAQLLEQAPAKLSEWLERS